MKRQVLFGFLIGLPFFVWSQSTLGVASKGIDMNTQFGGTISEIPMRDKEVVGSVYLNDSWLVGDIEFSNGKSLNNYPLRYDLKNNLIEIKVNSDIRALTGVVVNSFKWVNALGSEQLFINIKSIKGIFPEDYRGFLELLSKGERVALYKKNYINTINGAYVPALDMGDNTTKLVKKSTYFFETENQLFEVVSSRKKFAKLFKEKENDVYSFLKENNLSLKEENHLIHLCNFLNN